MVLGIAQKIRILLCLLVGITQANQPGSHLTHHQFIADIVAVNTVIGMNTVQAIEGGTGCQIQIGNAPLFADLLCQRHKLIPECNAIPAGTIAKIVDHKADLCIGIILAQIAEHLLHRTSGGIGIKAVYSCAGNRNIADRAQIYLAPNIVETAVEHKEVHIYIGDFIFLCVNSSSAVASGKACAAHTNVILIDQVMLLQLARPTLVTIGSSDGVTHKHNILVLQGCEMGIDALYADIIHIERPVRTGGIGCETGADSNIPHIGKIFAGLQTCQDCRFDLSPFIDGGITFCIADQLILAVIQAKCKAITTTIGQHIQHNVLVGQIVGRTQIILYCEHIGCIGGSRKFMGAVAVIAISYQSIAMLVCIGRTIGTVGYHSRISKQVCGGICCICAIGMIH